MFRGVSFIAAFAVLISACNTRIIARHPIEVMEVEVPPHGISEMGRTLALIGEAQGLEVFSTEMSPDGSQLSIQLKSDEIEIVAINTGTTFDVSAYVSDTDDVNVVMARSIMSDIRRQVDAIPGATVTQIVVDDQGNRLD